MRDRQRQRIWLLVNEGKARVDDNVGGDKVIVKEEWCLFNTLSKYSNFKSCDSRLFFYFIHCIYRVACKRNIATS